MVSLISLQYNKLLRVVVENLHLSGKFIENKYRALKLLRACSHLTLRHLFTFAFRVGAFLKSAVFLTAKIS